MVWVLVLGRRDDEGDTDAIEMLAFDRESGAAAGIGIPRDSWVTLPRGKARINEAWSRAGLTWRRARWATSSASHRTSSWSPASRDSSR